MCECICKHLSLCIAVLSMDMSPSKPDKKQGKRDIDITFSFAYMYVICYWNQFVPLLSNECILMKQKSHHEYCDTLFGGQFNILIFSQCTCSCKEYIIIILLLHCILTVHNPFWLQVISKCIYINLSIEENIHRV